MSHAEKAREYVGRAEEILEPGQAQEAEGRSPDVGDAQKASVATAFATLALYHQRVAARERYWNPTVKRALLWAGAIYLALNVLFLLMYFW